MPGDDSRPADPQSFLGAMDEADRTWLMERLHVREYPAGAVIIAAGDRSRELYVMFEGHAQAALFSVDGKVVWYSDIRPGQMFGELSALDGLPRSAFVTAASRVRAGVLAPADLEALLARSPRVAQLIMVHLSRQVRRLTERVYEYSTLLVRERLMRELLRRARRVDADGDSVLIGDLPTHSEIAGYIGTHRELVTKELGELARRGLVSRKSGGLLIPSLEALEREMQRHLK